jgi:type VI secretion system protein ImpG
MDEFLKYYEREISFTRQMVAEFARKHPQIAARLLLEPDKCEDPHMERLIEAFALECARLHLKIDDDFPEIAEPLLNLVFPHFIRPIPSMSIVRFDPETATVPPSGFSISENTALFSKHVDKTSCEFTTLNPVTLWPVEVVSAGFREPRRLVRDARQAVVITLKTCNGIVLEQIGWDTLRFFINSPRDQAFHLHELLSNNACHVEYVASNQQGKTETMVLSSSHIQPVGLEPREAMLPSLRSEFPGFLLLFDYFSFPEKFLFVDFKGLDTFRPKGMDTIELWIYLDRDAKPGIMINNDTFAINCTPAVNLFRQITTSMRVEHHKSEYRINVNNNPDAAEIYRVDKVIGTTPGSPDIDFKPLYSLRHHLHEEGDADSAFWHTQRRPSARKGDNGTDVFLSFSNLDLKPAHLAVEQIVLHADCSNRDLPIRLSYGNPAGDLEMETATPVQRTYFVIKPTPSRRPALGGILQWQLLSLLKPTYIPLQPGQEEALKAILRLYDFDDSPASRQIIDGIASIQTRHVTRMLDQSFLRGVEITLEFDERKYLEAGLYLFASVLERFFSQHVSSNSFTQLVARTLPGGELLRKWLPRRGVRPLL